jgi:hypothetical protein
MAEIRASPDGDSVATFAAINPARRRRECLGLSLNRNQRRRTGPALHRSPTGGSFAHRIRTFRVIR